MPPSATTGNEGVRAFPLELVAVRFRGQATATSRYEAARDRVGDAPWTQKVGFVERHHNGNLLVRGVFAGHYVYFDESDHAALGGATNGGVVGALAEILLGPPGRAVSLTVGAVIGSQYGRATGFGATPESLVARLRDTVPPSSSAIFAIAGRTELDELIAAVATEEAVSVVRRSLTREEERDLAASLASIPSPNG